MYNWLFLYIFCLILQELKQHRKISNVLRVQTYIAFPCLLPIWKLLLCITCQLYNNSVTHCNIMNDYTLCTFVNRFSGHFQYTWKQLQYCPSWFCCKEVVMWTIWPGNMYSFLGMHTYVEIVLFLRSAFIFCYLTLCYLLSCLLADCPTMVFIFAILK